MQKKQLKSLKRNIDETWKTQQDKNTRKECLEEENCQGDLWQKNCLGGWIKGMTKNIGEGWKEIGDGEKESNQKKEKQKQLQRKKKSRKKIQELESKWKKITMR